MAIAPSAKSPVSDAKAATFSRQEQVTSPHQSSLIQSDIRALGNSNRTGTQAFDLASEAVRGDAIAPPPPLFTLDAIIEQYASLPLNDSNVLYALQMGDLQEAVVRLIQENFQLHQEVESSRSDFEELRAMNIALQEQADARLGAADDARLALLESLEQARGELVELENQFEQKRLDHANDIDTLRQQRDALRQEIAELRSPRQK